MGKRQHSVPVPRLYKEAAKILQKVNEGEGLQDLIYNSKHKNIKALYALVCTSRRNNQLLEHILDDTGLKQNVSDPLLAKILITELLWGKKHLAGESVPVQMIMENEKRLQKSAESYGIPPSLEIVLKPRYARVNTLLSTVFGTIQRFIDDGWELIATPDSLESFLSAVMSLEVHQFIQDYHFEDCLVFHPKAELYSNTMVEKGSLVLQDKASFLPPLLLNPPHGSVVLDMCAAPGIKTSHLANLMANKGSLYAVDQNLKRFEIMLSMINKYCGHHHCVICKQGDSTRISSEQCPDVEYILVDPSCTGSGISKRIEDGNNSSPSLQSRRLDKLARFQERLLVQALTAFPKVKRVVYSTCSNLQEENEKVLEKVLARVPSFQVIEPNLQKPWEHRGDSYYSFGHKCLVADLEQDKTNGFFVAVLERVGELAPKKSDGKKRKSCEPVIESADEWEIPKKKKTIKRKKCAQV